MTPVILSIALAGLSHAADCPGLEAELAAIDSAGPCLTVPLLDAGHRARELGAEACLVHALAERGLPAALPPLEPPVVEGTRMPDKEIQDSYGLPNRAETDNFIAWWGDGASVSSHDVDDMLDYFEEGWDHEVDVMELPGPETSDTHKINIYVGDSGSGAPSAYGNAGYFYYDSYGYPMIVMALGNLGDEDSCMNTAVHELFHAVQAATDHYEGTAHRWIWESTAVWVENEVYPESGGYAAFLFGFAYMPWLPLDFYDYPDEGVQTEYHQYGSFIFPRYLSEIAADWTIVRDVWTRGSGGADPLEVWDTLLQERDLNLLDAWADFNAHNVGWDYEDGDLYEAWLDSYDGWYDNWWIADTYNNAGTQDWHSPTQRLPERYGVNNLELRYPNDGALHVELDLDSEGSSGSPATWVVTLVRKGIEFRYEPLEVVDGQVRHVVDDVSDDMILWITVGATCPNWIDGENFGYSYRYWVETPEDTAPPEDTGTPPEDPGGCGCAGGAEVPASIALFVLGAIAASRRRRR